MEGILPKRQAPVTLFQEPLPPPPGSVTTAACGDFCKLRVARLPGWKETPQPEVGCAGSASQARRGAASSTADVKEMTPVRSSGSPSKCGAHTREPAASWLRPVSWLHSSRHIASRQARLSSCGSPPAHHATSASQRVIRPLLLTCFPVRFRPPPLSSGSPHEPRRMNGASKQRVRPGPREASPVSRCCPRTLSSRHTLCDVRAAAIGTP